ncbi:MAG: hypothetical protein LCH98_17820 [Actinobacteria bacterium]|nr:hypothetical protein [Actinomycetota bacterium]
MTRGARANGTGLQGGRRARFGSRPRDLTRRPTLSAALIRRTQVLLAFAMQVVGLIATFLALLTTPGATDAFRLVAVSCLAVSVVIAVTPLVSGRSPALGVTAFSAVSVVVLALMPVLGRAGLGGPGYPVLLHAVSLGVVTLLMRLTPRWGIPAALVYGVWIALVRAPVTGPLQACFEGGIFANMGVLVGWTFAIAARAAAEVEQGATLARAAGEAALRTERRAFERDSSTRLLQDKILTALHQVGSANRSVIPEDARAPAAEALAVLVGRRRDKEAMPTAAAISAAAARMGVGIHLDIVGEVTDYRVRAALVEATVTVLTEVAGRRGRHRVHVQGRLSGTFAEVVLTAADTATTPRDPGGQLLARGSVQAMDRVGGQVLVETRDDGVTTRLRWEGAGAPTAAQWSGAAFAPLVACGVVAILLHEFIGLLYLDVVRSVPVVLVGMVLIPVLTVGLLLIPLRARTAYGATLLALLAIPPVLTLNLQLPWQDDWRFWFANITLDCGVAILSFRVRPWLGVAVTFISAALFAVIQVVRGDLLVVLVATAYVGPMACALGGGAVRILMDTTRDQVTRSEQDRRSAALATIEAEERVREADRRIAATGTDVLPVLAAISSGGTIPDDDFRQTCRDLEARLGTALDAPLPAWSEPGALGAEASVVGRTSPGAISRVPRR